MPSINNITTILIVDDEVELCSLLEYFFEDMGYLVEVSHDGKDGLAKAKSIQPDLILLDIRMPVVDGLEALKRIKEFCVSPVIMMTALSDMALFDKCLDAGAHSYILKPLNLDNLLKVVEDVLWEESVRKVSPIVWKEEMSVGDDEIDNDHKRLNQILNKVHADFNDHFDPRTLHTLFSVFLIHCRVHFEKEEKFQEKIGYLEIDSHRMEHQFLLVEAEKLENHLSVINESDTAKLDTFHLLKSFKVLWYQHLRNADMEFSSC
jgi:hemerythrin-like metal-binding protein